MNSVRIILFLAAFLDLECHAMDVGTAYLNADMKDIVFMKLPEGMTTLLPDTKYLQVLKALSIWCQAIRSSMVRTPYCIPT